MMKYLTKPQYYIFIAVLLLSSCSTGSLKSDNLLTSDNFLLFEKKLVQGGDFQITTYQKISKPNAPYVFYIEGDGRIANSYGLTNNPTPRQKTLLQLVAMDSRPNVVYISRLCQYTKMALNPKCSSKYWSDKRFSSETVEALNQVINTINNGQKFSLIGYSGGGAISVLIAAKNKNVKDIITIAGNLDIDSFTHYHKSPTMGGSLNPINYASQLRDIPQTHLSGKQDRIVPTAITKKYIDSSNSKCVNMHVLNNASHSRGWKEFWQSYDKQPKCL